MRDSGRQESRDIGRRRKEIQTNRKRVLQNVNMNAMKEGVFHEDLSFVSFILLLRVRVILEFAILAE